jgi:hypothetical protein
MARSKSPRPKHNLAGWGGKRKRAGRRRKRAFSERRDIAIDYFDRKYGKPKNPDVEMQNGAARQTTHSWTPSASTAVIRNNDAENRVRREIIIQELMSEHRLTHRMIVRCLNEFLSDIKSNDTIFKYATEGLNERQPLPAREAEIKRLEPGVYVDGKLCLVVVSPGKRKWIFRFIWRSTIRDMELGNSEMSLATARERAKQASRKVAKGQNPIDGSWLNPVLEGVRSKS